MRSLVQFYGAFHQEGYISIALEYMDGGALSDVLKAVRGVGRPCGPFSCLVFFMHTRFGLTHGRWSRYIAFRRTCWRT